uniref:Putative glutaredoxin n=1 Tax=Ornithodoros turicata TaxID=34597 RepID=A0A2R5LI13_9ACAR
MSAVERFVRQTIQQHLVVVFSKSYCPFCKKAKQIFEDLHIPYHAVELDQLDRQSDAGEIQQVLGQITGASTVPRIFINHQSVGGCSDLTDLLKRNQLTPMLRDCGAML